MPRPTFPIGYISLPTFPGAGDYNVTITINPDLSITANDNGEYPLDIVLGADDYIFGVFNNSAQTINSISFDINLITTPGGIFGFDAGSSVADGPYVPNTGGNKDNIQDWGTPGPDQSILPSGYVRWGYEGPDSYFGPDIPFNGGNNPVIIYFPGGIPPGGETYFGTEGPWTQGDDAALSITSTPAVECPFAEDEDDAPQDPITWPECDLIATRISVKANSPTVSPGRSFTATERVVQPDAGSWEIELQEIPINTVDDILLWREIESGCNGRANNILVPVYEGKPSSTILAAANVNIAIGAVVIAINRTAGPALEPGMQFSDPVGRMYRIKSIVSVSGNVYTVKVWPPIRTPITSGDDFEFNKPVCRCRLASDDGMNVMLELLTFARPSVRFLEDV